MKFTALHILVVLTTFCIRASAEGSNAGARSCSTIGVATSMESVRPRIGRAVEAAAGVRIRLARGEYESVQLLVAPKERNLKGVKVEVAGDLGLVGELGFVPSADATKRIPPAFVATNITVCVVGYVFTTNVPPYKVRPANKPPAVGWWPDPILGFQQEADVAAGDVQSFWVRVHCPESQPAGEYAGTLVISAKGEESIRRPLSVRVNNFSVPRVSPLPLLVSCNGPWSCGNAFPKEIRGEKVKRVRESEYHKTWRTRIETYADFLSEYYITLGAPLYPGARKEPNWDLLLRQNTRGRLGPFNLFCWNPMGAGEGGEKIWMEKTMPICRARLEKARALGIAGKAVFYGCDEVKPNAFTNAARTIAALHREFPGVPVISTIQDWTYGTGDSPLSELDAFCPPIGKKYWRPGKIAQAKKEGRQVWWYICCDPNWPGANAFIECPPAEMRSLMGAQTQKFKPDGFLYYSTMIWNSERPIEKGPFTHWEPRSFGCYHGDGQWVCCGGPDLAILPTIRLENFRDGLEDLWYAKLLERKLSKFEGGRLKVKSEGWAQRAREALSVPEEVATSIAKFSVSPAVLYRWRDAMADLIEECAE